MNFEIERKFLVLHDGWRKTVTDTRHLRDGLIGRDERGNKVRVRVDQDRAWITVKGARIGLGRPEFEYEIPRGDAEEMLRTMCREDLLAKRRHCVPHGGCLWTVDVYEGSLAGITLAEVELASEDQSFEQPDWVGREVSDDPRFRKIEMLRLRRQRGKPLKVEDILALPVKSVAASFAPL